LSALDEIDGVGAAALVHYQRALHELRCFTGDPVGSIDAALAEAPDFAMAHAFKGWLFGLSTEKAAKPTTRACADAARRLARTARERAHAAALSHLAGGRWHQAGRLLAEHTVSTPLDGLALQVGHQIDFFTGNAPMLRQRLAQALPSWSPALPGYHAILGMQAFGLEECGDYAGAEAAGRAAVALEPRDGWAQHAVAHVMEMQARQRDGIAWMRGNEAAWTGDSFLQIHNWWHLALFHFELGDHDAVLGLYDGPIAGAGSTYVLNLDDASAILWRLHLAGVVVGNRWATLARRWLPKARDGCYAFNDMHAMMAFVGAGLDGAATDLLVAQQDAMARADDNAGFTREVGYPAALAIRAFGERRYADAVALLSPLPPISNRFGGSHAQRDVIDLTLIEAALRAGDETRARELIGRRAAARPASPFSQLLVRRLRDLPSIAGS
jgi:hypothetical protein